MINNSNLNGGYNSPLKFYEPMNLIVFLSFYSPIILAISLVSLSFIYQNFKGLICFGYLLGVSILRNFSYMMSGATPLKDDGHICNAIQYSKYGNGSFSSFVFAFIIMYFSIPMFTDGSPNYWVFSGLLVYCIFDIGIKFYKKCILYKVDLIVNLLAGLASAGLIVAAMYAGGSGNYLFFNQATSSSTTEVCSMPSNQTFKCSVYKNGELIGDMPS